MNAGQDLGRIESAYDTIAWEYAEAFAGEHEKKPMDREVLGRFAREIRDRRPVWDLSCGGGQTARYLRNLGVRISGLDLSAKLLEQAKRIHPEIDFRKGNILDLDFADGSVAGAIAFYAIVHFTRDQVATMFREAFRVLQPGGLFLLTYHVGEEAIHIDGFLGRKIDIDFSFFPSGFISRCLADSGFEGIEVIEREPYPGVEYESRRAYVFSRKPPAPKPF